MKKLSIILGLLFLCSTGVFADPQQTITNAKTYATLNLQKAPASENKQQIKNTKSWFCINIIINGKVKDISYNNNE